jgi:signal transduction histidine kinase
MSRAHLRFIFNRFYRIGSEVRRSHTGTGLGLFIVKSVVKGQPRHRVRGERGPGQGLDVHDHAARGDRRHGGRCGRRRSAVRPSMARLLIVEDEKNLAQGMRFNFELEGYEVDVVGDGSRRSRASLPAPRRATTS